MQKTGRYFGGDAARTVGIVLTGRVQITKEDYHGNCSIVAQVGPGELFAEAFACAGVKALPGSAIASEPSEVLLIDLTGLTGPCENACPFHRRLVQNLLTVLDQKNLLLNQKISILSKCTTKEKLMAYLLGEAKEQGSDCFRICYNRQELADYLGVERSTMSVELGKLQKEGRIRFVKNNFQIL